MTADTFLLSDTHHDESTGCQVKSILLQIIGFRLRFRVQRRLQLLNTFRSC